MFKKPVLKAEQCFDYYNGKISLFKNGHKWTFYIDNQHNPKHFIGFKNIL